MRVKIVRPVLALVATMALLLIGGASSARAASGNYWTLCIKTPYGNSQPGTRILVTGRGIDPMDNTVWDYGDGLLTSCWWNRRVYPGVQLTWQLTNSSTGWSAHGRLDIPTWSHPDGAVLTVRV